MERLWTPWRMAFIEQASDGTDDLIFESLELKEMYDHAGKKRTDLATDTRYACNTKGCFDPCAGNGHFPRSVFAFVRRSGMP